MNSIIYLDTIKTAARSYVVTMPQLLKECHTPALCCQLQISQIAGNTERGEKWTFLTTLQRLGALFCDVTKVSWFWKAVRSARKCQGGAS